MPHKQPSPLPHIIIVDDDDAQSGLQLALTESNKATAQLLTPGDVEIDDLRKADVVLLDFDLRNWVAQHDHGRIAELPPDGLALAGLFRRYLTKEDESPPTALAILTGKIDEMSEQVPPDKRPHVLAMFHNVEWVFRKEDSSQDGGAELYEQVLSLAEAVQGLQLIEPHAGPYSLTEPLGLIGDDDVIERCLEDVAACCPPVDQFYRESNGLQVVRWLLHRIFPYPCFLWDLHYVAARLRLDYLALRDHLDGGAKNKLTDYLDTCRYQGILKEMGRDRWWRGKLEQLLWDGTDGNSSDSDYVRKIVREWAGEKLTASRFDRPIVGVDETFRFEDECLDIDLAVRLHLDDWPPYAEPAWVSRSRIDSDERLRALVVREDLEA